MSLLALALAGITVAGDCPGGRTLEAADLAGTVVITDIIRLIPGVSATTIDGFDVRPHAGGATPAGDEPWLVLIDGVPASTGAFGGVDLHLLPVEPSEIVRVVYCPGPGLAAGRFSSAGRLEIFTSRLRGDPAWGVRAEARVANETGDPGPRRYLPAPAPNVDKIGPDISLVVLGPVGTAGGRFERRYPSDPAIFDRNADALGRFPAVRYGAVGVHLGHPRSALRFDGGASYASDLWYLGAAGRELPVRRLGGQGTVSAGAMVRGLALGARASVRAAGLDRRPEIDDSASFGFEPRWRELGGVLDVEVRLPRPDRVLAAGAHLVGSTSSGPGLSDGEIGLLRLWVHRAGDPRAGWRRRSDVAIVAGGDEVGLEAALAVERSLPHGTITVTVARDDRIPEEHAGTAYWRTRGYAGLDRPATPYAPATTLVRGTEWSGRVDVTARAGAGVTVHASAAGRDIRGVTMERAEFLPDSVVGVAGAVSATAGHRGRLFTGFVAADGARGRWSWGASYRFERAVAGDDVFRSAWDVVPAHLVKGHVSLRPDPSILVRTTIEARSSTQWDAYRAFNGAVLPRGSGIYRSGVPSAMLFDIDFEKSLIDGRLALTASLRNLLNAPERAHPLGATLAFRLWIRAALRL